MLDEFKKFIFKGDVVALSTGVLIGGAFGKIVDAFREGIVQPLLSLLGGSPNVAWKYGMFDLGLVISAMLAFLITAAIIFFFIVKPANKLQALASKPKGPEAPPEPSSTDKILMEIRDSLKKS